MKLRKNILTTISIAFALLANVPAYAKLVKSDSIITKAKQLFEIEPKDCHAILINILAEIETDLGQRNFESIKAKSNDIEKFLEEIKKPENSAQLTNDFKGERVLELKYGSWFNSRRLLLALPPRTQVLNSDMLKEKIEISSYFKKNELNQAQIKYVSYNLSNEKFRLDMRKLLAGLKEGNSDYIRENIQNIYYDILSSHGNEISLVPKIRDSLVIAKFLIDSNQYKAAQTTVSLTDEMMLKLVETTSNSPSEQKKIKALRKELSNIEKVSDANYISEWEKIPEGIEDLFNKK
jgi:hypothetical protein